MTARKRLVIGLFEEVRRSVEKFETFLKETPLPTIVRERARTDKTFRPLVISPVTTDFYDVVMESTPEIKASCQVALAEFYEQVRITIRVAEAFQSPAFLTLSDDGRAGTVDDLWIAMREAEKLGWQAMYELELAYPREWFSGFKSLRSSRSS
ncbi:hypothetical protein [Salinarimonas soli]|uniref:Uncharacterized protein n=1 Tax=Salinarimonas soli TaxID=1638099 RepID=A0A5B2VE84_9HYPH|nr:hypothetical protein [Salinarimonas soli]KAA2236958.1 hypothetical protein F0L46_11845 [Salinarimonas soli]